jgi:DNA uptake protein ComE-like DNA-binding protein
MGFSERQATSILKYKQYLGGSFISKEKFRACFMISEEKYRQMEPYLLLPDSGPDNNVIQNNVRPAQQKPTVTYQKFDPNRTDLDGWKALGFSEKQAQVIINYSDRKLRGSFKSLEDIQNCFVISPEKFEELKPYIVLDSENMVSSNAPKASFASNTSKSDLSPEAKTDFSKTDLNQITFRQLQEFGFDEKSAAMILSYRKKLGGFVTKEQIVDTYDIDKILAQRLIYVAPLDVSNVPKYKLSDAPEEWLKTHPYFKYSADKIIYYRITNPDDRKIWKFLKLKPEYENRMRLYVRND